MRHDRTTMTLTAGDVAALDVTALRARGPAAIRAVVDDGESESVATEAVERNLDTFIGYLLTHPDTGACRLHLGTATLEVMP